jgi:hypothetical protein
MTVDRPGFDWKPSGLDGSFQRYRPGSHFSSRDRVNHEPKESDNL